LASFSAWVTANIQRIGSLVRSTSADRPPPAKKHSIDLGIMAESSEKEKATDGAASISEKISGGVASFSDDFRRRLMAGLIVMAPLVYAYILAPESSQLRSGTALLSSGSEMPKPGTAPAPAASGAAPAQPPSSSTTVNGSAPDGTAKGPPTKPSEAAADTPLSRLVQLATPSLAIFLTTVIYLTGAMVELLGEVILIRLIGNFLWGFSVPLVWATRKPLSKPCLLLKRGLLYLPALYAAVWFGYYFLGRAICGLSDFRWLERSRPFSKDGLAFFESLPAPVNDGLQAPFGYRLELAWRYLQARAKPPGDQWLKSLENRNRDLIAIITAVMISACTVFWGTSSMARFSPMHEQPVQQPAPTSTAASAPVPAQPQEISQPSNPSSSSSSAGAKAEAYSTLLRLRDLLSPGNILWLSFVSIVPAVLLYLYFLSLRRSIVSSIEWLALQDSLESAKTAGAKPTPAIPDHPTGHGPLMMIPNPAAAPTMPAMTLRPGPFSTLHPSDFPEQTPKPTNGK
jgi:hypothetical protein